MTLILLDDVCINAWTGNANTNNSEYSRRVENDETTKRAAKELKTFSVSK